MSRVSYPHQLLFSLLFFSGTQEMAVQYITHHLKFGRSLLRIATPNPEQIVTARMQPAFARDLQQFSLYVPDGIGILWAAQQAGTPLVERITGADIVRHLFIRSRIEDRCLCVIGGEGYDAVAGVVCRAGARGTRRCQTAQGCFHWIAGYEHIGDLTPSQLEKADARVRVQLEALRPEIICVALGAPWQEAWVARNGAWLEQQQFCTVVMVVGGAIDMLIGKTPRAPHWVRTLGAEWLYRLIQQPSRWRRQLKLLRFVWITLRSSDLKHAL